jgi:hypothetical protein
MRQTTDLRSEFSSPKVTVFISEGGWPISKPRLLAFHTLPPNTCASSINLQLHLVPDRVPLNSFADD